MKKAFFIYFLLVSALAQAQVPGQKAIISGPMLGPVETRTAVVWVEAAKGLTPSLRYWKKGQPGNSQTAAARIPEEARTQGFQPVHFQLTGLDVNTSYEYEVELANARGYVLPAKGSLGGSFTTKDLWQFRKPVPEFSFLTGSCSYKNQPEYDRPGRPYGGDSSIYETMARQDAAFMLWLGDNWYTREVDYHAAWGLWYRAQYDRSRPVLQAFWKKMPHLAIWDDHDFGPNDMGREYILKDESRKVFMSYWANPSYGEDGKGIYTQFSYGDVDIFMLDDRTWRSSDRFPDSVDGKPNPLKRMYGEQQMEWLKNALAGSAANFKIIATGSQVLNPASPFDCFRKFPVEYLDLMQFIRGQRISGVLFLTGDRHHSEVMKVEGLVSYPLYDITVSPLTSGTHVFGDAEKDNKWRVFGLDQKQNFGRISITGEPRNRKLTVSFVGVKGEDLGQWSVMEKELRVK